MRLAVLVKQVPKGEELTIVDGRLRRDGVALEVNAYCRRANAQAVAMAGDHGEVVAFTMGPPAADAALREMIACGATRGVHLCDPMFAGSDTLATSKALALAIVAEGPFDIVLCGLNSLDADTGQVGPQVAELMALPFVSGAREISVVDGVATITSETDDGEQTTRVTLPAVVSAAERLCDPSKADVAACNAVDATRIDVRTARMLGLRSTETGADGSPTRVGKPRVVEVHRQGRIADDATEAVRMLRDLGAFAGAQTAPTRLVADRDPTGPADVWCFLDDDLTERPPRELLGAAAEIAATLNGSVTALTTSFPSPDLGAQGADRVLVVPGDHADAWGNAIAEAVSQRRPRILLVEGTQAGRAVASRVAARHGWGLIGDGVDLEVDSDGSLTVWKPALGGRLVVPITSTSPVQIATIRPGVLPVRSHRTARRVDIERLPSGPARASVTVLSTHRIDAGRAALAQAKVVVAVGQGVQPDHYDQLQPLLSALGGAEMAATRKVTDRGWMPRSRQIGVTGLSVGPRLFVSIGASGRFNHATGFQTARVVLALNIDPSADIFGVADVGLIGPWSHSVRALVTALGSDQRIVSALTDIVPSPDA